MRTHGIVILSIFLGVVVTASAQVAPVSQTLKWRTLSYEGEFSIAMPEGSLGFTDNRSYSMSSERNSVTKKVVTYRNIDGAVLVVEVFEGGLKGIRNDLIGNLTGSYGHYSLVKSQRPGSAEIDLYAGKSDRLHMLQQFILTRKKLYVVQGYSTDENNTVVAHFFQSLAVGSGGTAVMPNLLVNDDPIAAQTPPDIVLRHAETADMTPITGKPDREPIFLYKARPQYSEENRRAGLQGEIALNVLLGADGKVLKAEFKSGQPAFLDGAVQAAMSSIFVPAEKDGRSVSVWKVLSYSHSIY